MFFILIKIHPPERGRLVRHQSAAIDAPVLVKNLSSNDGNVAALVGGRAVRAPAAKCFLVFKLLRNLSFRVFTKKISFILVAVVLFTQSFMPVSAQTQDVILPNKVETLSNYIDQTQGKTTDELVAYAIANNPELEAVRREVEAAEALIKQANLRANPNLELSGSKNPVTPSNSLIIRGSLPLELFNRRGARVQVAEQEAEVRQQVLADRERLLAAEVRSKFGTTLALILKLSFVEETLAAVTENYKLVAARVNEGKTAPLEQNMEAVELNRLRALREMSEGNAKIALLELKNLIGMPPETILRLHGDFADLLNPLPPPEIAAEQALKNRPDLQTARALVDLAQARIEQAQMQGKPDASVSAGYQRMNSGFPFRAFDSDAQLAPIRSVFHFVTFGVTLNLPVFNKNQGSIEAAAAEKNAASKRLEFGELTVRREVAAAFVRYERAARAMEIYRAGVEKLAEINLGVVRQTYELGARNLLNYIAEQRRYIEIKNDFIDAQLQVYLARVEILRAVAAPELITK